MILSTPTIADARDDADLPTMPQLQIPGPNSSSFDGTPSPPRNGGEEGPLSTASLLALPKQTAPSPTLSSTLRSITPSPGVRIVTATEDGHSFVVREGENSARCVETPRSRAGVSFL